MILAALAYGLCWGFSFQTVLFCWSIKRASHDVKMVAVRMGRPFPSSAERTLGMMLGIIMSLTNFSNASTDIGIYTLAALVAAIPAWFAVTRLGALLFGFNPRALLRFHMTMAVVTMLSAIVTSTPHGWSNVIGYFSS